ncbi:cytochrome c oxidase assembly protein [Arthrobacter sp. NPDC089319]|uniref:cytochrome c oxidase assembly protein n=1 Tax=Arthrobacter sp. NPDC089319 TaxID=3155915 RepID=UPI00342D81A1
MIPAHSGHAAAAHHASMFDGVLPLALVAAVGVAYLVLAWLRSREDRGWSGRRTVSFLGGALVLALGLTPQLLPLPPEGLPVHMVQHLLIGMYAPLGLVLGAPVTLLLRSVPHRYGKKIGKLLRSRPLHLVANPATALLLTLGGLAALYFTPLYSLATGNPLLHHAIHLHFLAAGYLFAWVIAGPDPAPRRPSVPMRLVVLGVAIAGHAVLSQLLYAGLFTPIPAPSGELRLAGELMYYGGDVAGLLLAFALVTTWRPVRKPASSSPKASTAVVIN